MARNGSRQKCGLWGCGRSELCVVLPGRQLRRPSRRRFHTLPYRLAQQRTMLATNQRDIIQPNPKSVGQIDLRLDGWVEVGVKIVLL